jgi:hypothetical protein
VAPSICPLVTLICAGLAAILLAPLALAGTDAEKAVDVPTRPGQRVRMLLLTPEKPVGSVILLAGGHGNLNLGKDGSIGWGKGNQLVRTRADYAAAGFVTAVPDIAPDLKQGKGVVQRYRWSERHARDISALVKYMRGLAAPVYLVGTSRATLSIVNAAVRDTGPDRPDAIVITSGMLMHINDNQPSAERSVGHLERIKQPTFIVNHEKDGCAYTPAAKGKAFIALLKGSKKADLKIVTGGQAGTGDPCEAYTHHGFYGQDKEVVAIVSDWLKALPKP